MFDTYPYSYTVLLNWKKTSATTHFHSLYSIRLPKIASATQISSRKKCVYVWNYSSHHIDFLYVTLVEKSLVEQQRVRNDCAFRCSQVKLVCDFPLTQGMCNLEAE